MNNNIREIAYRKYQLDWMISHKLSVNDIYKVVKEWSEDPDSNMDSFDKYIEETGFNGSLWVCYDEFLEAEYTDAAYMKYLLTPDEYKKYCKDIKELYPDRKININIPDITVVTKKGVIKASVIDDNEYPGIDLSYEGENGDPGAIMEYNSTKDCIDLRVYAKEDPNGDPAAIYKMSYDNTEKEDKSTDKTSFSCRRKITNLLNLYNRNETDWIPVNENKPHEGEKVQVTYLSYYDETPRCDTFAYFKYGNWFFFFFYSLMKVKVVAWKRNCEPYYPEKE